ncbi:MFS transporter [Desulfovibrio desulfuricans]|nr:MFS transporter [Desulfovibrio desulfuricans]MCB6554077.1 MFS transporter [Desulfovibrio desulfuricans]MCB6565989.1 MFS transporter [Desulfovibrio desulfuricans]MCB7347121.1 MFS transporter [Desulfovibrio desulfuricans]
MGVCSAASGIGGILFNPVGAYMITLYGWRTTYCIFGMIVLLFVTPILAFLLRDYPEDKGVTAYGEKDQQKAASISTTGVEYRVAIRMPIFYGMVVFAFLMISVSTLNLFIPNYVTGLDYSLEQASFVTSAVMVGVTIGKVILGMVNDKNSALGVAVTAVCGICGSILLLIGQIGIGVVTCGVFLFGWAYAGVTVQTPMLVRAVFGSKSYTQIYSNISISFAAGGALMAGMWGILADHTNYRFILALGFLFLIIASSIGIYALQIAKNRR